MDGCRAVGPTLCRVAGAGWRVPGAGCRVPGVGYRVADPAKDVVQLYVMKAFIQIDGYDNLMTTHKCEPRFGSFH